MAESSGKIVSNNVNLELENKSVENSESVEENKTETVMEPMLLEDYNYFNVPRSLRNIFNHFKQEGVELDKNDITVIFIYILMLETGFITADFAPSEAESNCNFHYKRLLSLTNAMPKNWKEKNAPYRLSFVLAPYPAYICAITCIPLADDLVVNGSIRCASKPNQNWSMLVDPAMYILNTSGLFQNLRHLSQKFKTTISHPSKMFILEAYSVRPACLNCLPPEIFSYIKKYCDRKTVLNLNKAW